MKSRFFTDTRDLDGPGLPIDRVCVCLCLNRRAYEQVLTRAGQLQLTSGAYIDRLIWADAISAAGIEAPCRSGSPSPRLPPAPPAH